MTAGLLSAALFGRVTGRKGGPDGGAVEKLRVFRQREWLSAALMQSGTVEKRSISEQEID